MAHVRPHGKRIAVRLKIDGRAYVTTVNIKPTKTGLNAAERQAQQADARLRAGESWITVRAWLRGESANPARSLGYYAQHLFDHADVEMSTLMGYESAYHRYWSHFDGRMVETLTQSELEAHLAQFGVSRKTKRNALSVLRRVFDVAKKDRVVTEAPTDDWTLKKGQDGDPDPYTEAERDKLLNALKQDPIAWRYFTLAFHTGMRTGELLGLEWNTLERPYIHITQSRVRRKIKTSTKTDERRRVIAPDFIWAMLADNPTRFQRSFVFLTPEDRPFIDADWLMDKWTKAHKRASVRRRLGPYPWRSTYISLGLASGQSLIWVSKQTGHDMITMQKHYARWIKGREDADMAELRKAYPTGATSGATESGVTQ